MSVFAYYALHYGVEYFNWSLRSIRDYVDEILVVYTPSPSFGVMPMKRVDLPFGESKDALKEIAYKYGAIWVDGFSYNNEGVHRSFAVSRCIDMGADYVLAVDADEIWSHDSITSFIKVCKETDDRHVTVPMMHFWRCMNWVCHDPSQPHRMTNAHGKGTGYRSVNVPKVFHFGYAQSINLTKYKISIHGHLSEWRKDWFMSKFLPWTPGCSMKDVHPTNYDFWNPVPIDGRTASELDSLLWDHPYRYKSIIL